MKYCQLNLHYYHNHYYCDLQFYEENSKKYLLFQFTKEFTSMNDLILCFKKLSYLHNFKSRDFKLYYYSENIVVEKATKMDRFLMRDLYYNLCSDWIYKNIKTKEDEIFYLIKKREVDYLKQFIKEFKKFTIIYSFEHLNTMFKESKNENSELIYIELFSDSIIVYRIQNNLVVDMTYLNEIDELKRYLRKLKNFSLCLENKKELNILKEEFKDYIVVA